jgi:2-polyprenyl-3-methyl-5-hydroxy-6-metoxy-1,4-benzoquinol methylase
MNTQQAAESASPTQTFADPAVLEFYKSLPFNYRDSVEESVRALRNSNPVASYPVLIPLLKPGLRVLEVGSGTGWFSNCLADRYKCAVTAIDFNPVAVQRAREVAQAAGLSTEFRVEDLFLYEPPSMFDLVVSIGVLHHTNNCHAAIRRCCQRYVRPGGHVFIGLYHTYGRKPFLDHFRDMRQAGASEEEMFARYRQLHAQLKDETLLRSWFRDQVLHPNETQHTIEEIIPLLRDADMELLSTSINRFAPIESTEKLIEEEKTYTQVAEQRLRENQYFTGFFVFLARRKSTEGLNSSQIVDSKPYVRHHPIIGYEYIPDTAQTLPTPAGGQYDIRVNSAGIRSDREYTRAKPPGTFRILAFGDSMSAGQFLSNEHRFSELLERRIPKLEVINLSLEGSGTDQQLLTFQEVGKQYEFDLVLLFPFLQNIRRNMVEAREGRDPATLRKILLPKPRFELVDGKLVLRNVPVPKERVAIAENDKDAMRGTDVDVSFTGRLKTKLSRLRFMPQAKKIIYGVMPWEPFPEYKDPKSPAWKLMVAIIAGFKELAGDKPLVVVPTFYSNYVQLRMARNYWIRYQSLTATPGIHAIDLLPYFKRLGADAGRCYQDPFDMHFSAYGNLVLADAVERELRRLRLLPGTA